MAEELKPVGNDATGYELLARAMKTLLNQFPGLNGQKILFEELGAESGIAFSADAGALVMSERVSITDHVMQSCQFPFLVVYRTTATREFQKMNVSAFLDTLGKWLCKEPVEINGETHRLSSYPAIFDGRKITRITRNNSYGTVPNENKSQDWILPVSVQYTNEFDM
ncbi:MAG: hypothetical protein IJ403_01605 [Oscillospiraceae bacterium]|nr:hypothetical protein [Oscillospiraceae bacterium]